MSFIPEFQFLHRKLLLVVVLLLSSLEILASKKEYAMSYVIQGWLNSWSGSTGKMLCLSFLGVWVYYYNQLSHTFRLTTGKKSLIWYQLFQSSRCFLTRENQKQNSSKTWLSLITFRSVSVLYFNEILIILYIWFKLSICCHLGIEIITNFSDNSCSQSLPLSLSCPFIHTYDLWAAKGTSHHWLKKKVNELKM